MIKHGSLTELLEDGFLNLVEPIYSLDGDITRYRFVAAAKHRNRNGVAYGGMLMTFADRTMALTPREAGRIGAMAIIQFDMRFIRAVNDR